MAVTLNSTGITFPDGTTRSTRNFARIVDLPAATSTITSSSAAGTQNVDYTFPSTNPYYLPAYNVSYDYWTYWTPPGYSGQTFEWYPNNIQLHRTASSTYVRIEMYHGANGGAHAYYIYLLTY
jgi:hypothetical protein